MYLTNNIPLFFQTSTLDTNNVKGKVMLKIEIIYQADLRVEYTLSFYTVYRSIITPIDMSLYGENRLVIYAKVFFFYYSRGLSCVT